MLELIAFGFQALPWVLALGVPLLAMLALVLGRRTAGWWVAVYYILLFCIPNSSFGLLDPTADRNFYARGTGTFFFPAVNILLFGLAIQAFFARRFAQPLPVRHNLGVPALLFGLLMLGNLVAFAAMPQVRWFQLLAPSGLLQVVNFMLAFYVLVSALRDPTDLRRFLNLLLVCVVARGLWGALRFAALGGDPANYYDNFQHLGVKLTFFDINDSLMAVMALFLVTWRLASGQLQGFWPRAGAWAVVALELFIIVFSYRRIAWGGLALVVVLLTFSLRGRWRWGVLISFAVAGLPLIIYKMAARAGSKAGGSFLERALPDVVQGGQFSFTTGRFAELYAAWLTIRHDWLVGLGAWGRYDGFRFSDLAWHRGDFSWMHSGVLHLTLKTGVVGLAIALAAVWLYAHFVWVQQRSASPADRGVLLLGGAGALFMLPAMLVGTTLIEFRTMQLFALCIALPYVAWAVSKPAQQGVAARPGNWFGIRPLPAFASASLPQRQS